MGPRITHRLAFLLAALMAVSAMAALPPAAARGSLAVGKGAAPRPNILLIVSDDQAWSTFSRTLMPRVYSDIVDRGALFRRAYVGTSLCCPSRAQILTGLTSAHTGVDENDIPLARPTIVQALHDRGYRTLLAGKYLNSHPDCAPLSEFDRWACVGTPPSSYSKVDPLVNLDGTWTQFHGYQTDVLANQFVSFLNSTPANQPFFAMVTPTTPHIPADDPRYDSMPITPPRPPSYDQETRTADTPVFLRRPPLTSQQRTAWDTEYTKMARNVRSLDDSVGTMLDALGSRANDTIVVFMSDNGYLYGEHRRLGKSVLYEESVRVPMVIRYPPMLPAKQAFTSQALVANLDLAPTFAELAGFSWGVDGKSLVPLLNRSKNSVRKVLLLDRCQGVTGENGPCTGLDFTGSQTRVTGSAGVVTATHAFIRTFDGQRQLFDLTTDPYEMVNLAGTPGAAAIQADLEAKLDAQLAPSHVDTTILDPSPGTISERAVTFHAFTQSRYATFRCRMTHDGLRGTWHTCDGDAAVEGGLTDGDYLFEIKAIDERGKADATPASRMFSVTSAGPPVQLTSTPPASTTADQLAFGFTSPIPGMTYECRLSPLGTEGPWSPCSPSTGASYAGLGEGLWNFEVRATNGAGSTSDPPAAWLTRIDRTGPALAWAAHPWSPTNAANATFRFVGDEQTPGNPTCKLDGLTTPCTPRLLQVSGLTPGQHSVAVTVRDALKNKATSTYTWTVERTPPVASIVDGPPPVTNAHNATFEVRSNEPAAGFLCAFDGGLQMPCPDRVTWFAFPSGPHTMQVWAVDRALNRSVAPATYAWTIT